MATVTVLPNADHTTLGTWNIFGGPASRYLAINNGTATPDDTDYVQNNPPEGTFNRYMFMGFEDMPGDFDTITSVTAKVRQKIFVQAGQDGVKYQIFESDETTALTDQIALDADGTDISSSYRTDTLNFTVTGSTSKTAWDGARMKFNHDGGGDGDDPDYYISELELDLVYTATGGGSTSNPQAFALFLDL